MTTTTLHVNQSCTRCGLPLKGRQVKLERKEADPNLHRRRWRAVYQCPCGRRGWREW